jgi:hypothetical protein
MSRRRVKRSIGKWTGERHSSSIDKWFGGHQGSSIDKWFGERQESSIDKWFGERTLKSRSKAQDDLEGNTVHQVDQEAKRLRRQQGPSSQE